MSVCADKGGDLKHGLGLVLLCGLSQSEYALTVQLHLGCMRLGKIMTYRSSLFFFAFRDDMTKGSIRPYLWSIEEWWQHWEAGMTGQALAIRTAPVPMVRTRATEKRIIMRTVALSRPVVDAWIENDSMRCRCDYLGSEQAVAAAFEKTPAHP